MPECKREVDYYLDEMKYYPKHSESYQYYEAKLDVTRMKIEKCKEEYDKKEIEIIDCVKNNKKVIDSIKEDEPELYSDWCKRYKLDLE